ncbi:MAG: LCP family protein [Candidatus Berkelbacteria bacterium]|nr:LCP family protein [Candidatus Berkelbacteria bacterium]
MFFRKPKQIDEPKKPWKKVVFGIASGIVLALILWFGINILLAGKKIFTGNFGLGSSWFLPKTQNSTLNGEGDGRINILLLGIGGSKHPGGNLTDTIILASFDPVNKKVALLSIPRDLYVPIDKAGYNKINYAHAYGEENNKTTGGGPELAKKTVSKVLDVPVHYFVRMDFEGFTKLIDAVGGVDIYVEKTISDPYYPATDMVGYDPIYIKAGWQHMDGKLALKYTRSRETTSDFDRSARQQTLIKAFFEKALSVNVLLNPKTTTSIINILGNHLKTDLSFIEIEKMVSLAKGINKNNIAMKVLDSSSDGLLTSQSGLNGYYLVPKSGNFKEIQQFVRQYLTEPYIEKETAKIEVQNGTDTTGLGQEVADILKAYGYQITKVTTAPKTYAKTTIIDYTSGQKEVTLSLLKKRLNAKEVKTQPRGSGGNIDLLVIVGQDFAASSEKSN